MASQHTPTLSLLSDLAAVSALFQTEKFISVLYSKTNITLIRALSGSIVGYLFLAVTPELLRLILSADPSEKQFTNSFAHFQSSIQRSTLNLHFRQLLNSYSILPRLQLLP